MRQGFSTAPDAPIFISLSNNSKKERLGYRGVYDLIKDLAKAGELEGVHPHRL